MALSLPGNPDLERFRRDARRLQRGVRDRDPQALALVARHHPGPVPEEGDGFALTDAQLVLARAYGFSSWPRLRDYLRRSAGLRRDPTTIDDTELFDTGLLDTELFDDHGDGSGRQESAGVEVGRVVRAVLALACLRYDGADDPARWARGGELLRRHPELPRHDVFVAATVADLGSLRSHLRADPGAAVRS
jgi:hypothetical protein